MTMIDFVEIGTADFDTLVQEASDDTTGICVEPISYYINRLPNKPNVTKVNAAVSLEDVDGFIDIYYIPGEVIDVLNLPEFLRGCNSINKYHLFHSDALKPYVRIESVPQIPIGKLLTDHNVVGIKHLKIDTEGCDCYIMDNLLKYLTGKSKEYYPLKITFESNESSNQEHVARVIKQFTEAGYTLVSTGFDTILELS